MPVTASGYFSSVLWSVIWCYFLFSCKLQRGLNINPIARLFCCYTEAIVKTSSSPTHIYTPLSSPSTPDLRPSLAIYLRTENRLLVTGREITAHCCISYGFTSRGGASSMHGDSIPSRLARSCGFTVIKSQLLHVIMTPQGKFPLPELTVAKLEKKPLHFIGPEYSISLSRETTNYHESN